MDLSRLDSNKYQAILRFKRQIADSFDKFPEAIISKEDLASTQRLNNFGETEAIQIKQQYKSLSDEEMDTIVTGYQAGKSTYALAKELGCHRRRIANILKKRGVSVDNRKAMKKLDEDRVVSLYANMHTTEEIAKQFDVHPQAVIRCLKAHGVKMRSRWDYMNR